MERQYIIGMDEAGFGPNLGPLVIAATLWSGPKRNPPLQLWDELETLVTRTPGRKESRLHVGDSKEVYSSQKGIGSLERSVLSFAELAGIQSDSLKYFLEKLQGEIPETFNEQPWYQNKDAVVPMKTLPAEIVKSGSKLKELCENQSIVLESIAVDLICPPLFNRLIEKLGNKSKVLTDRSLRLLKRIRPERSVRTDIYADKHGGRNRYLEPLHEAFPDQFFMTEIESQSLSTYREQKTTISFGVKSEKHFPVALASMVAKYLRESCMSLFNSFWQEKVPGVKQTKGYPQDAVRFRAEVKHLLSEVCPDESVFWRAR